MTILSIDMDHIYMQDTSLQPLLVPDDEEYDSPPIILA